jgi:hypothetical protein
LTEGTPQESRFDALAFAGVGFVALGGYLATLHGSVSFWDTGELETVPYMLGIAHPTACPSFVLLGWLFSHALPFGGVSQRIDAMCAVAVACSAALLYPTMRRLGVPALLALVCALGFAFAPIPWRDATRAEDHDLALLFRVLALFFGLRWSADGGERNLFLLALFAGLSCATHGLAVLLMPSLVLLLVARRRELRPRSFGVLAGGFLIGLLPFVYLPLRSAYVSAAGLDPTRALGLPPGRPFWDYDHPATLDGFFRLVTGADFDTRSAFAGFLDVAAYPRFVQAAALRVGGSFGWLGVFGTVLGVLVMASSRRLALWAVLVAGVLPIPYVESYGVESETDRYYLLPLWCAAVAIALGATALATWLSRERAWQALAATALAASFLWGASERRGILEQRSDPGASDYIAEIERVTPSGSIVVAEWAFATPLAYAAYVEHSFDDRIVVCGSPTQFISYYRDWLGRRPLYLVSFANPPDVPGFALTRVGFGYNVFRLSVQAPAAR